MIFGNRKQYLWLQTLKCEREIKAECSLTNHCPLWRFPLKDNLLWAFIIILILIVTRPCNKFHNFLKLYPLTRFMNYISDLSFYYLLSLSVLCFLEYCHDQASFLICWLSLVFFCEEAGLTCTSWWVSSWCRARPRKAWSERRSSCTGPCPAHCPPPAWVLLSPPTGRGCCCPQPGWPSLWMPWLACSPGWCCLNEYWRVKINKIIIINNSEKKYCFVYTAASKGEITTANSQWSYSNQWQLERKKWQLRKKMLKTSIYFV